MASVIWIDSDSNDDLVDICENPRRATPHKGLAGVAGPSTIAASSMGERLHGKKKRRREELPEDCIIVNSKASNVAKAEKGLTFVEDDDPYARAIALALQKEGQEEEVALARDCAAALDERSTGTTSHCQNTDENVAPKRRKTAKKKTKKDDALDDGIVFEVTIDSEGNTIEGDDDPDNAAHFKLVKRDFEQALSFGLKVKTVRWFVNAKLEARFEAAKEILESLNIDTTERSLFHGTADANIEPILKGGFLIPGVTRGVRKANGAAYGLGIYLAVVPSTSFVYCQGAWRMFMCRVITGRSTSQICRKRPLPLGQNDFESYAGAGVYVVKYADLVVPRYVVEFEHNAALANFGLTQGNLGAHGMPMMGPQYEGALGAMLSNLPLMPPGGMAGLFAGLPMALPPVVAVGGFLGAPVVPPITTAAPKRAAAKPKAATKRVTVEGTSVHGPICKGKGKGKMKAEDYDADWGK
ncbi:hypothetical protein DFH06DRAFT_1468823 [Mycena polygramma]|nr:hypothetical protein DFH06DRAFT_1468823 [Mycena polygramma]